MDSGPDRQRSLLGVQVTAQLVAVLLAALLLTGLLGMAVLSWLERTA